MWKAKPLTELQVRQLRWAVLQAIDGAGLGGATETLCEAVSASGIPSVTTAEIRAELTRLEARGLATVIRADQNLWRAVLTKTGRDQAQAEWKEGCPSALAAAGTVTAENVTVGN